MSLLIGVHRFSPALRGARRAEKVQANMLRNARIDLIEVATGLPYVMEIAGFCKLRFS